MKTTLMLSFILVSLISFDLLAQSVSGNLEGHVISFQNKFLDGVNILVKSEARGTWGAVTDHAGYFKLVGLPAGNVDAEFQHIGYQTKKQIDIKIHLGKTTDLGIIQLDTKTLESDEIIITAATAIIDPYSTELGANLNAEQFEMLPTERDFYSIIALLPQANTSYLGDDVNVGGSTGQENAYYIDGMNTTDMYKGIGGTELPYNFVEAVEFKSGGYEAEYGRSTGGIINVVTHSGGNQFQVGGFGYYTGNTISADARRGVVDVRTGDFSRYDAGFSLGGPIITDMLWYYGAYNIQFENEELNIVNFGAETDKKTKHLFAGKLTWKPTEQSNVFLSAFGDPTSWDRVGKNDIVPGTPVSLTNKDVFLSTRSQGGINVSINGNHLIDLGKDNLLITASLASHNNRYKAEPATERGKSEPLLVDASTGIWSGGYGEVFDRKAERTSASLALEMLAGQSSVKIGFQFEDNVFNEDWRWLADGPQNAGWIWKYADNIYIVLPLDARAKARNRVLSNYIQGSFLFHPRFVANLGIRWDGQYFKGYESGWEKNINDQFQPRLGFVYQPLKTGRQKITGSYGRFYEQIQSWILNVNEVYQEVYYYDHDPLENPSGGLMQVVGIPGQGHWESNLKGEYFDEFTLGYEFELYQSYKMGVRGIYREIKEIIQNSDDPTIPEYEQSYIGNPGRGILSHMPEPRREYKALEFTVEKFAGHHFNFFASYVLSRNYGNYTGVYSSDYGTDISHGGVAWDYPEQLINATGLLPNDRTHVFKFNGFYRTGFGLISGTAFTWQSGTPLSELGMLPPIRAAFGPDRFLSQRGTVGRTPDIWDLNLRLTYAIGRYFRLDSRTKLVLDILHLFSQRKAVLYDQIHYFNTDDEGNPTVPNPSYLEPLLYQPPMTVRLGLEIGL